MSTNKFLLGVFLAIIAFFSYAECTHSILDYDNDLVFFVGNLESQHVTVLSYDPSESIHDFSVFVDKKKIVGEQRYYYYNKLFDMCVKVYP